MGCMNPLPLSLAPCWLRFWESKTAITINDKQFITFSVTINKRCCQTWVYTKELLLQRLYIYIYIYVYTTIVKLRGRRPKMTDLLPVPAASILLRCHFYKFCASRLSLQHWNHIKQLPISSDWSAVDFIRLINNRSHLEVDIARVITHKLSYLSRQSKSDDKADSDTSITFGWLLWQQTWMRHKIK